MPTLGSFGATGGRAAHAGTSTATAGHAQTVDSPAVDGEVRRAAVDGDHLEEPAVVIRRCP